MIDQTKHPEYCVLRCNEEIKQRLKEEAFNRGIWVEEKKKLDYKRLSLMCGCGPRILKKYFTKPMISPLGETPPGSYVSQSQLLDLMSQLGVRFAVIVG